MMKKEKKNPTEVAQEFLRMVEQRSEFKGELSYTYVAGFMYSLVKDLAHIPKVQEVLQMHLDCYKIENKNKI